MQRLDEYYPRFGDTLMLPFEQGIYYLPKPKNYAIIPLTYVD